MKKNKITRISASLLLLPLLHAVLFALFMGLSGLLEIPCDRDGIYIVTMGISILLLILFPVTVLCSAEVSVGLGIWALCRGESVAKNVIIMALWVVFSILTIWWAVDFWYGTMGV
jgi:hypothetical protein